MEACVRKPEVKKKPKPTNIQTSLLEKPAPVLRPVQVQVQKPVPVPRKTPVVPPRPKDSELSHTQYRQKQLELSLKLPQQLPNNHPQLPQSCPTTASYLPLKSLLQLSQESPCNCSNNHPQLLLNNFTPQRLSPVPKIALTTTPKQSKQMSKQTAPTIVTQLLPQLLHNFFSFRSFKTVSQLLQLSQKLISPQCCLNNTSPQPLLSCFTTASQLPLNFHYCPMIRPYNRPKVAQKLPQQLSQQLPTTAQNSPTTMPKLLHNSTASHLPHNRPYNCSSTTPQQFDNSSNNCPHNCPQNHLSNRPTTTPKLPQTTPQLLHNHTQLPLNSLYNWPNTCPHNRPKAVPTPALQLPQNCHNRNPQINGNVETKEKQTETPAVPLRPTEQEPKSPRRFSLRRRDQSTETQTLKQLCLCLSLSMDYHQSTSLTCYNNNNPISQSTFIFIRVNFLILSKTPYFIQIIPEDRCVFNKDLKCSSDSCISGITKKISRTPFTIFSRKHKRYPFTNKNTTKHILMQEFSYVSEACSVRDPSPDVLASARRKPTQTRGETCKLHTERPGKSFTGMFKRSKPASDSTTEEGEGLNSELSASTDSLSENKEKGNAFTGMFKRSKPATDSATEEEKQPLDDAISTSSSESSEASSKENLDKDVSTSSENLSEKKKEKGVFSGLLKKTPKTEKADPVDGEEKKELTGSSDDLTERSTNKEKNIFSNMFKRQKTVEEPEAEEKNKFANLFKKPQKAAEEDTADKDENTEDLSGSCENIFATAAPKEKKGFAGIFKRSSSIDTLLDSDVRDNINNTLQEIRMKTTEN
ncbi:hypothetical protein WMY93_000720 [Mugilogobius chulae]|uniref:FAM21/CAPZIP domain-containing protein n=1 Tax=Mugilogobius chulae TaxID=88201 RepID=A0AAW0Q2U6_9GOBI